MSAAALLTAVAGTATYALAANPATGTTDNGQTLNVAITSPADGAVLPAGTTSVPLAGQVSIGDVPVSGEAHVAVVLDESGSLGTTAFAQEKAAANVLHQDLEAVEGLDVFSSAIFFGTTAHVAHADAPVDTDVAPANGTPDFRDAVTAHPYHQGFTNYKLALDEALGQLSGKPGIKMIFFISDGEPNAQNTVDPRPTPEQIEAMQDAGIVFHGYAMGSNVFPCEATGSWLQRLADQTGGTCTTVENIGDLDAALTGTTPAGIEAVESRANGDAFGAVDVFGGLGDVSDAVGGLVPGENTIDLRATADDDSETQVTASVGVTVRRPVVTVEPASGGEGDGVVTHRVTLDHAAVADVTARVRTADGSATAGSDYGAVDTVVTFAPGDTEEFVQVPVAQDELSEVSETYAIGASEVSHGGSAADAATGTILDDDAAGLLVLDAEGTEGDPGDDSRIVHEVALTRPSATPVTATLGIVAGGSAGIGSDVEGLETTVGFAPGETSKHVEVRVVEDVFQEPTEQYTLRILGSSGDTPVADGDATGTIHDDDVRRGSFSCQATALRLGGSAHAIANPPLAPCAADGGAILPLPPIGLGLLGVSAGVGLSWTDASVGKVAGPGDHATAGSQLFGLRLRIGTSTLSVDAIDSWVSTRCAGGVPQTSHGGSIGTVRLNGLVLPVRVGGTVTIPLGLATIRFNAVSSSGGVTTRRAIEITGALGTIVVGEARSGASGPVCEELPAP